MKLRFITVLLTLALILSTFSGCGLIALKANLDAAEDALKHQLEQFEAQAESAVHNARPPIAEEPKVFEKETVPGQSTPHGALTKEEAEAIAFAHAGLNSDAVERVHSEYEIDDGVPHYDVNFYKDHLEYEYEIHASTGAILSYEQDNELY